MGPASARTMAAKLALPALTAAAIVVYALLAPRGLSADGRALLDGVNAAGQALRSVEGFAALLERPHAGIEWLVALVVRVTGAPERTLQVASLIAAASCVPAVFLLARRTCGDTAAPLAASVSALLFALSAPVLASATVISTTSLVLASWCWLLVLTLRERQNAWTNGGASLLGALLLVSWPPVALWFAVWLVVTIVAAREPERVPAAASPPGMLAPSSVPVGVVVVPLASFVLATALHPGFWSAPTAGWERFVFGFLGAAPAEVLYFGTTYPPARLPWHSGLAELALRMPPVAVVAALLALLNLLGRRTYGREPAAPDTALLAQFAAALAILVTLPWMFRGFAIGRVDTTAMMAPLVCVIATPAIARMLTLVRWSVRGRGAVLGHGAVALVFALLLSAPLVDALRSRPHLGTYYNWFVGGTSGAIERGLEPDRERLR